MLLRYASLRVSWLLPLVTLFFFGLPAMPQGATLQVPSPGLNTPCDAVDLADPEAGDA